MYSLTENVVGSVIATITLGVRQGSPTSCLLFIIYVNDLIRMIREGAGIDGFLSWLHILVLMDDTVLIATSRANMIKKIEIMNNYCNEYEMRINLGKTKFFVINGNGDDGEPMHVGNLIVEHCEKYIYLGSPFTADGSPTSAVKAHAVSKIPHVLKFVSFLRKNDDVPFIVKRRIFDAALMSSILYGCESWLCADLRPMVKLYNWCLKELLGVRKSTCNDVCYVESGYPSLKQQVRQKQHKFFRKMWLERQEMNDDPLVFIINLTVASNTVASRLVQQYISSDVRNIEEDRQELITDIVSSDSSRRKTYSELNPRFEIHHVYKCKHSINEIHRIAFTRFRVSGHNLACETGRWNRRGRGRLPMQERVCPCGQVQTEIHVVQHCPSTNHIRQIYGFNTIQDLFSVHYNPEVICKIIYEVLEIYK